MVYPFIPATRVKDEIATTVYQPEIRNRPMPVIVMGHGIGAIKAGGLAPFARAFNSAGYAAVTFDYIGFGASEGSPVAFCVRATSSKISGILSTGYEQERRKNG
jgi:dienelactone hydrolase